MRYSSMAFEMLAVIGLFTLAGYKLDEHFTTPMPYYTIVFALIGVALALYRVMKDYLRHDR
jgi:F0F1-type ATP synthase assembly protein I